MSASCSVPIIEALAAYVTYSLSAVIRVMTSSLADSSFAHSEAFPVILLCYYNFDRCR